MLLVRSVVVVEEVAADASGTAGMCGRGMRLRGKGKG